MIIQFKIFKKILFGIALCGMPMVLCGMNSARRVGSAKKTARILPAPIEETMPRQIVPATAAFQIVAAATTAMDRPDSPHTPMGDVRKATIETWAEEATYLVKVNKTIVGLSSVSFDTDVVNVHDQSERVSGSVPVSDYETPMQGISTGKMSSSSSCNSHSSQLTNLENRMWSLERAVEDTSLAATDSVVSCHEKLNKILDLSDSGAEMIKKGKFAKKIDAKIDDVSKAVMTLDRRQHYAQVDAQEKFSTLQKSLDSSTGALRAQKEVTEALAQNLKEKDKKIETLESGISTLALQLTRLQTVVQRQQRPWWKRCGCFTTQNYESENSESDYSEEEVASLRAPTLKTQKNGLRNNVRESSLPSQVRDENA